MQSNEPLDAEKRVWDHLLRYRLTTKLALERLVPNFSGIQADQTLGVMIECGFLETITFPASTVIPDEIDASDTEPDPPSTPVYALTQKGFHVALKMLGLPNTEPSTASSANPPLNYQSLTDIHRLRAYGMLAFCALSDTPREVLTSIEVLERHPSLVPVARKAVHFYREDTEHGVRLGVCYVDPGRSPQRLAQELRALSDLLRDSPDAIALRRAKTLALGMVVADDAQNRQPLLTLIRQGRRLMAPLTMVVAPQLAQFQRPAYAKPWPK